MNRNKSIILDFNFSIAVSEFDGTKVAMHPKANSELCGLPQW
jgi:hypothetical protein